MFKNFLGSITRNGISLLGTALALAGLVLIVSLVVIEKLGFDGGPYLGILTYLILPMIFVVGLILIPTAIYGFLECAWYLAAGDTIEVDSHMGKGTRMTIQLPRAI